jgi:H+/Cl- antiporter ClcA
MMTIDQNQPDWKTRAYTLGAVVGLAFGLIAAYLFARAAEEETAETGAKQPEKIKSTRLMSVSLAALSLMRQITELGRKDKK